LFEFENTNTTKRFIANWINKHTPPYEQGERDVKAGIPDKVVDDILPWEKRLIESFEEAARYISHEFHKKEEELYKSFKEVQTKLQPIEVEYKRLRKNVGDRDPEIFIAPIKLLFVCILSVIGLSFLNTYFLTRLFDSTLIRILLAIAMAASNVTIGYYTGRLVRQHGVRHLLIVFMGIIFLTFLAILVVILNSYQFEIKSTVIVIFNFLLLFIITVCSFLAHDIEPNYPKTKKIYDRLIKERIQLAGDRKKYFEICNNAQLLLVESAQELNNMYKDSLIKHYNGSNKLNCFKREPEFKTVPLILNDMNELAQHVSTDVISR